jgi:hypothetical protein
VLGVSAPQGAQEPRDGLLRDLAGPFDPLGVCVVDVASEVTTVCGERVSRQAALDVEVGEPVADGTLERGRWAQLSTCSTLTDSMPNASATGAHVTCPPWVLRP